MSNIRTIIGFSIAFFAIFCMYFQYVNLLFLSINLALLYDAYYMLYNSGINIFIVGNFILTIFGCHYYLLHRYNIAPLIIIKMITIAQLSDVYQYIAGSKLGRLKIGWISKNKTYEGYLYGLIMTVITFSPILYILELKGISVGKYDLTIMNCVYDVVYIYILGVASGLLSSLFKRTLEIKDYSNLLGPHGGWIDRIDSIILPSLLA